jgi:hypothetical protein
MTPKQMADAATQAKQHGVNVTLVLPRPFKRPPKFPRGELLCQHEKSNVYSFDPAKILAWLETNKLI